MGEKLPPPLTVRRAFRDLGEHIRNTRKINRITAAQLAARAGISAPVLRGLENGSGTATLETFLRVARVLGTMPSVVKAVDPFETELGRMRAEENLPDRVRPKKLSTR